MLYEVITASGGDSISVDDTTKNQGGSTAGASTTYFYLSTNTVLDAGDTLLGSRTVGSLAAGAVASGSTSVTLPNGLARITSYNVCYTKLLRIVFGSFVAWRSFKL